MSHQAYSQCFLAAILFLMVTMLPAAGMADTFHIDNFISPEVCSGCHGDIFAQWENSMHNLAHEDGAYVAIAGFLRNGLKNPDEIEEAESCVKCHTPVGYVTGYPKQFSDNREKVPDIARQGIQCDYCHSATGTKKMYNNGLILAPGQGEDDPGIKYGPFDDAEPDFHDAEFSKFHTESGICGTCHNVKHVVFGTDLETTYDEWAASPYNTGDPKTHVNCQGCHMYQRPDVPATGATKRPLNPGPASDYTEDREHIFTHYFVGANQMIPGMAGDEEKITMARQRLEHAASLSIDAAGAEKGILKISVTNTGAGHSIPTGVTDLRQVWLEVRVKNAEGNELFSSGVLDSKGYLGADAVVYKTVYGDEGGKPTSNINKARSILKDYRIKAGQTVTETYKVPGIAGSGKAGKGTVVVAKLMYRSLSHKLLDMIPDGAAFKAGAVTMAHAKTVL